MPQVVIFGPAQVYGEHAETPERYEMLQRSILKKNRRGEPWLYLGPTPVAYVSGGKLIIDCPNCIDGPSVDFDLRTARCCGCGAVFQRVIVPSRDEMEELKLVLGVRPVPARNTKHVEDRRRATVRELDEENQSRGLPSLSEIRAGKRAQ